MWSNGGEWDGRKGRDWIPVALNAVVRQSVGGVAAHHDGHPLQRRREVMALQDLRTTDKSIRSKQPEKRKGRNLTWICVYLLLAAFCLDRWILSFSCLISLCRFPKSRSKVANLCKEYKESKRRDSDHCADGGTHLLSGSGCERCHLLLCDGERQRLSGQGAIRTGQGPTALPAPVDASDGRHFDRIAFCKGKYQ